MSITADHVCRPMTNPRHLDTCRICAKPMPYRQRNMDLEREFTQDAAKGLDLDPEPLITFSEARAQSLSGEYVTDPMLVLTNRDRLRDAREEAADLRNHLVWWLIDHVDHPKAQDARFALRHLILLYDLLAEDVD